MFMFESQLVQMPAPRDIILYWPSPRAFSVVQKPRGWAHISVQKPRGTGGMVTGQIDTCIATESLELRIELLLFKKTPCWADFAIIGFV